MSRNIGVPNVSPPPKICSDKYCPFHGTTRIRGKITTGEVVSKKSNNTVIIRQDYVHFVPKYQRYERRNTRITCHLPGCLNDKVTVGDDVIIGESRKISKTKAFIVLDKVSKEEVI
ncbi:MAG: 30S ribosomal protein S17 [Promethearchaeia archaeon]